MKKNIFQRAGSYFSQLTKSSLSQIAQTFKPSKQVTKGDLNKELGESGDDLYSGYLFNDYNPDLQGTKAVDVYEEMRRSDPMISAILKVVKLPIHNTEIQIKPYCPMDEEVSDQDAEVAQFVEKALFENIDKPFNQLLGEILTCLEFGYSVFERVYRSDGEHIWLKDLAFRRQQSIEKWQQDDGSAGITQSVKYGVLRDGNNQTTINIPADKLLIFSYRREGNNYEGMSLCRECYMPWFYKKTLYRFDAIRHERGAGFPMIWTPQGASPEDVAEAKEIAANIRQTKETGVVFTGPKADGWDLQFADTKALSNSNIQVSINHYNREIAKVILAQWIELDSGGSYALQKDQSDFTVMVINGVVKTIEDVFNWYLIPELIDLNFDVEYYPTLKFSKVTKESVSESIININQSISSGTITMDSEVEKAVRDKLELPAKIEEEIVEEPVESIPEDSMEPTEELNPEDELAELESLDAELANLGNSEFREPVSDETKKKISEGLKRYWATRKKNKEEKIGEKSRGVSDLKSQIDGIKSAISNMERGKATAEQRKQLNNQIKGIRDSIKARKEEIQAILKQDREERKAIAEADKKVMEDNKKVYETTIKNHQEEIKKLRKEKSAKIKSIQKQRSQLSKSKKGLPDEEKEAIEDKRDRLSDDIDNIRDTADDRIEDVKTKIEEAKNKYQSQKDFLKEKKETINENKVEKDNSFSELSQYIDNNLILELQKEYNAEDWQRLKKKGLRFNDFESKAWRPLTFAERKVNFNLIKDSQDKAIAKLDKALAEITDRQTQDILEQVKKAVKNNDVAKLKDLSVKYTAEIASLLTDIKLEMFEVGKKAVATEMDVAIPATSGMIKGVMRVENTQLATKVANDIVSTATLATTQLINKTAGNIKNVSEVEAVGLVNDSISGVLTKAKNNLITLTIGGGMNTGRASVYSLHPEKVYALQYSAIVDDRTTNTCLSLDGRIVKPGSKEEQMYSPPNHQNCRSIWVELLNEEYAPREIPIGDDKTTIFKPQKPKITGIPSSIPSVIDISRQQELIAPIVQKGSMAIKVIQDDIADREAKVKEYESSGLYPNRVESHKQAIKTLKQSIKGKFKDLFDKVLENGA